MRVEDHFVRIYAVREAVMLYDIDCVRVRVCVYGGVVRLCIALLSFSIFSVCIYCE